MKKMVMVLVVLMVFGAGQVFAQQGQGFIQPTLGIGFGHTTDDIDDGGISLLMNVNFVHSTGFTISAQKILQDLSDAGMFHESSAFGLGYTFDGGDWSAGANLMMLSAFGDDLDLGININGTWWATETLGLTDILGFYFFDPGTFIGFWAGISMRF